MTTINSTRHRLRIVCAETGSVLHVVGGTVGGPRFSNPMGVAADRNGAVYVADSGSYRIIVV